MNVLKVWSFMYYYFWYSLYTTEATKVVKLFSPRLRRRKDVQVLNLA